MKENSIQRDIFKAANMRNFLMKVVNVKNKKFYLLYYKFIYIILFYF